MPLRDILLLLSYQWIFEPMSICTYSSEFSTKNRIIYTSFIVKITSIPKQLQLRRQARLLWK